MICIEQDDEHSKAFALSWEFWNLPRPAPRRVFIEGSAQALGLLSRLPEDGLAVVGTRAPQIRALNETRRVICMLRGQSLVILSGLALGIDAAAHEAAIDAGLPTIAILASGVDSVFPKSNEALAEKILRRGGLLISEYPPGESAYPGRFLHRNRLIGTWAKATWIVEASFRSGALNTARWARECGADVYVSPCFPGDRAFAGNQSLIDDFHAKPLWGGHSLGSTWIPLATIREREQPLPPHLSWDARLILRRILGARFIERLAILDEQLRHGWSPERFHNALHSLVQSGLVIEQKGLLLKNPDLTL